MRVLLSKNTRVYMTHKKELLSFVFYKRDREEFIVVLSGGVLLNEINTIVEAHLCKKKIFFPL